MANTDSSREILGDTGRTAVAADGSAVRIFLAARVGGPFDGAFFEVDENELTETEAARQRARQASAIRASVERGSWQR